MHGFEGGILFGSVEGAGLPDPLRSWVNDTSLLLSLSVSNKEEKRGGCLLDALGLLPGGRP